tara:strand:+ start:41 stop:151 length:111 start_codon:yes stop_codon:yes gene_type:complete
MCKNPFKVDVEGLNSRLYFVKITDGSQSQIKELTIE